MAKAERTGRSLTDVMIYGPGLVPFLSEPEPGQDPEIPGRPPESP
jgi:hypothetical protein